jgi:hypothetical protein
VLAGIATASVIRRPVATPSSWPSRKLSGVRGIFRVSALAAALERQGRCPPDAHFTGARDRARFNERLGRAGGDRVESY